MKALIVSRALDTNGQNARYARAAERWGDDPDVLRAFIVGRYDPADVGGRFREAARRLGGVSIRSAHVAEAYFQFPADIRWTRSNGAEVQRLADEADVIHLNNSPAAYQRLRLYRWRKPALLHHHGTLLRNNPAPLLIEAKRYHMVQAVSTVDLKLIAPDLMTWLPTAYDLDAMMEIRAAHRREPDGRLRIVSCPTNLEVKSTARLQAAAALLQAEGLPLDLEIVTGRPWAEALAVKATADVYFDQVLLGYGCNAVEAWGMGIPVIAGAAPETLAAMRAEWNLQPGDPLPFLEATEETIADAIRSMYESPALREEYAGLGASHAARYHAERPALARLMELYGRAAKKAAAIPEEAWVGVRGGPGRFISEAIPAPEVRLGSRRIRFRDGEVALDTRDAERMRNIASMRPRWQIRELLPEEASA